MKEPNYTPIFVVSFCKKIRNIYSLHESNLKYFLNKRLVSSDANQTQRVVLRLENISQDFLPIFLPGIRAPL